jgi:hypothetical protein
MRHTLKAVFDRSSDARHALDELLASGYPSADLALSEIARTGPADDAGHTGVATSIRHTAARLLGALHHKDAETQRHVVTLTTDTDPAAERAAIIIARFHPSGLEDTLDAPAPRAAPEGASMRRRYPPGTAPGALQHHPHEDSHYFGTQDASAPPAGNTYRETLGSIARWSTPDDEDALAFIPDAPTDLRQDDALHAGEGGPGQAWEDVEPVLKSDWERRHGDSTAAAWDKVKMAVRHGWERTRH